MQKRDMDYDSQKFFYVSPKKLLCLECGHFVSFKKAKNHHETPVHLAYADADAYRHRDDSVHQDLGQPDCYICCEIRRLNRELARGLADERLNARAPTDHE